MANNPASILRHLIFFCALILVLPATACGQQVASPQAGVNVAPSPGTAQGALWKDIPQKVDAKAKYLFYLHGLIIENEGRRAVSPRFGAYEYEEILKVFASKGFIVISEARSRGTDVQQYAAKVVGQIRALLKAGVQPQRITVVGASRGGAIAVATSTQLKNRDVNYVLLAACGNSDVYRSFRPDLWGNVLSIWDFKDDTGAGTCQRFFNASTGLNRHQEVELKTGLGHGIVYRAMKEWMDPAVEWADQP